MTDKKDELKAKLKKKGTLPFSLYNHTDYYLKV